MFFNVEYENNKSGETTEIDDWSYANGQHSESSRELLGFDI